MVQTGARRKKRSVKKEDGHGRGSRGTLTNGRDSGDDFTQLEFIKDCSFSRRVETDHEDSHFLLAEEARDCQNEPWPHGYHSDI